MKTVLVTGGTGYIGSHTAVELIQRGFRVMIADNLSNSREEVVDAIEKITGKRPAFFPLDLCDREKTNDFVTSHRPDAVIHFAAFKAVGESVEQPLKYYRNNLLSLIHILEAFLGIKGAHFLFSSSCSVYGQCDKLPITEDTPLHKTESPYGNTKQISEEILADTARVNPLLQAIALRYFNPAGAHESGWIGEYPLNPPSNLVPVITQTAAGKRNSLTVYGNNYATSDGTCIRDYIHVVDIAKAHVAALERLLQKKNKKNYEVYNLGTGKGNTVMEAIHAFEKVTGVKVNYEIGNRREGDVEKVWADTTLANKELGWKSELSLEDIMQSAWNWEMTLKAMEKSN